MSSLSTFQIGAAIMRSPARSIPLIAALQDSDSDDKEESDDSL
jgi:hypothetical protein